MLEIFIRLPGRAEQDRADFAQLSRLFPQAALGTSPSGPVINVTALNTYKTPSARRFDVKILSDDFDSRVEAAHLALREDLSAPYFINGILKDVAQPQDGAIPIEEAAERIEGKIIRPDHIGINVPRSLSQNEWKKATQVLSRTSCLYEYPKGADGYDPKKNLWVFAAHGPQAVSGPQTKFELAHDRLQEHSVVQIDIKTKLGPKATKNLFPEGFALEGLEQFFWSVPVSTGIAGLQNLRLDLRFAHNNDGLDMERHRWEDGSFLTRGREALPADKPARLPEFKP